MHKTFIISVGLILLCGSVRAETGFYPSPAASYGTGFLRVEPATGIPGRTLNMGFAVRGFTYTPMGAGNPYRGGSLVLGMDYGIVDNFAVRLWVPFYLDMEPGWDNKAGGLGDVRIGLKNSVEDVFAIQNFLLVPTGKGILGPENGEGRFRYFTTGEVDFGMKATLSYDIENVKLTGGGEYIHHGLKDLYIGQLGASVDLEKFQPFVELIGEDRGGFDGDDGECGPDISYITPGLVFNPNPNLSILLAVDVKITWATLFGGEYTPDWRNDYYVTAGPGKSQPWAVNLGVKYTLGKPRIEKTMVEGGLPLEKSAPLQIQFIYGKTTLTENGKNKLDKLALTLIQNPGLGLEVRSYIGESGNSNLSRKRIEVVKNYLATKGIPTDRLSP